MKKIIRKTMLMSLTLLMMMLFCIIPANASSTTGWVKNGGNYYYKINNQYIKNQVRKIGQYYYYFDKNGVRKTGWITYNGKKYCFNSKTAQGYTTITKVGSYFYIFRSDATLVTQQGFYKGTKYTYYVRSGGKLYTGFAKINGVEYYFKPDNARMAKSEYITVSGNKYYVFSSGRVRRNCWYNNKYYDSRGKVTKTRTSTAKLYKNNGTLWKTVDSTNGTTTFPIVDLKDGSTCLGWSKTKGKSKLDSSDYESGDKVPIGSGNYYMVIFNKSCDKAPATITSPTKYSKVYMVGDSRTVQMAGALGVKCPSKVEFVAKSGEGLQWFKNTGYNQLLKKVASRSKNEKKAVVINLGINDLQNINSYITYMKQVALNLKKYNCTMYYMSLNPVNSAMIKNTGTRTRTEANVKTFNSSIKANLCSGSGKCFTFINTYTELKSNGWLSINKWTNKYDGLHYSYNTYLRIFNSCMNNLNK